MYKFCGVGVLVVAVTGGPLWAGVTQIDSLMIQERRFNDFPNSTLNIVNDYPNELSFDEPDFGEIDFDTNLFANMHAGWFSADGGASAFDLLNEHGFSLSFDVTLDAPFTSPRKEAGLRLDTGIAGEGLFIVTSDGEVAAFGGIFPFHQFGTDAYTLGETASLALNYRPGDGAAGELTATMEYVFNGESSGLLPMGNLENGVIDDSHLGLYLQNAVEFDFIEDDFGSAVFENIALEPLPAHLFGDMNLDGAVDTGDVAPFVLALTDPEGYTDTYGIDPALIGDINGDGAFDTGDVAPFVQLIVGNGGGPEPAAVPEPGTAAVLGAAAMLLLTRRRRGDR